MMKERPSGSRLRILLPLLALSVMAGVFLNYTQPASSHEYDNVSGAHAATLTVDRTDGTGAASLEEQGIEHDVGQRGTAKGAGTGSFRGEGGGLALTVDRTDDDGSASACLPAVPNDCSFRGAIAAANAAATSDSIGFDETIFGGAPTRGGRTEGNEFPPQTITLGGTEIVITSNGSLTINGPGANLLTISGNNQSRIITNNSATTTISGIRFTLGNGVGALNTGRAGAIYNASGILTLNRVVVTGNTAANGGGLNNASVVGGPGGNLTINDSVVSNNTSTSSGGGMQNFSTSTLRITNSEISGNTGGSATGGGAIQGNGTVQITNSTLSGNNANAGDGGALIYNGAGANSLTLRNTTFAGNTAFDDGGGIFRTGTTSTVNIANNIIALNTNTDGLSPDLGGTFTSLGNNLIGNVGSATFPAGPGDQIGTAAAPINPMLGPLANNGGPSQTRELLAGSTAINAGSNAQALDYNGLPLTTDQRGTGFPRISGGTVDIGAFERPAGGPCAPVTTTHSNNTPTAIPTGPAVVTSTLNVAGAATFLTSLKVTTNLTHTFAADLDITLQSPAGTVVTMTTDNGAGNDNVFNGTVWGDFSNPFGQVPYTTNPGVVTDHPYVNLTTATPLVPEEAFDAFRGENPNGTWTITISDDLAGDGGSLASWSMQIFGVPVAPTLNAPATFSSAAPVAIPTGPAVVTSTVTIAGQTGTVEDIDILTSITHTFAADLDITVQAPSGRIVTLTTDNGAGNDNVFNGTTWDSDANPAGQVPYTTNAGVATDHPYVNLTTATPLTAEESLGAFRGEQPNGIWTITVSDDLAGDGGSIDSWSVVMTTNTCPGPSAAGVEVTGRVATAEGQGIRGAVVSMTDQAGNTRTAVTSSFGYYRFAEVEVGRTYVVSVASKRYTFISRTIDVSDNLSDIDFTAEP